MMAYFSSQYHHLPQDSKTKESSGGTTIVVFLSKVAASVELFSQLFTIYASPTKLDGGLNK
jgi:hypothetical protein